MPEGVKGPRDDHANALQTVTRLPPSAFRFSIGMMDQSLYDISIIPALFHSHDKLRTFIHLTR